MAKKSFLLLSYLITLTLGFLLHSAISNSPYSGTAKQEEPKKIELVERELPRINDKEKDGEWEAVVQDLRSEKETLEATILDQKRQLIEVTERAEFFEGYSEMQDMAVAVAPKPIDYKGRLSREFMVLLELSEEEAQQVDSVIATSQRNIAEAIASNAVFSPEKSNENTSVYLVEDISAIQYSNMAQLGDSLTGAMDEGRAKFLLANLEHNSESMMNHRGGSASVAFTPNPSSGSTKIKYRVESELTLSIHVEEYSSIDELSEPLRPLAELHN